MDNVIENMLKNLVDKVGMPKNSAFNLRSNGKGVERYSTKNIKITSKVDKPGIDVVVAPNTVDESVMIPVVVTETGVNDMVYNTFEIGENSNITVVSGCGIHNGGEKDSEHDGMHEFFVRKGAKMRYVEKHYGEGDGTGNRILNPITNFEVFEDAQIELDMTQIKGVDKTKRDTNIILHENAKLIITERLLTDGVQEAISNIEVKMVGENASARVISRSVAKGSSVQEFYMSLEGEAKCKGHIQCDSIIMDKAKVTSIPKIAALDSEAELIHEAAIGRIANDQVMKLMTIGMNEEEAEEVILKGFLK